MTAYCLHMEQLPPLLAWWRKEHDVYVPVTAEGGHYDFAPWREGTEIAFDYDLAYNTLKRYFLPPNEDLLTFDLASYEAQAVFEDPKQILFGVHPYDVRAVNQLDQLMEEGAPDRNYMARREATVVMAMEPQRVADTAFWSTIGADVVSHGYDLHFTRISPANFLVEVGSVKGEELLLARGPLPAATAGDREAVRKAHQKVMDLARSNRLNFDWRHTPKLLEKGWNSGVWREKAELCLACGSCNVVCPTCYCFNVSEEADESLKKGRRFREWDGCMLVNFATVAGGHNFRTKALQRYRHRYMRKGKYISDKIGELGCVGCGRCVRACTARIANPREVFNALWEDQANAD